MSDACKFTDAAIEIVGEVRKADDVCAVSVLDAKVVGDTWETCGKGRYVGDFLISEDLNVCIVE